MLAVDLFEEPHGDVGGGDAATDWHAAAQRIGDHVLGRCPRWLVLVQARGAGPARRRARRRPTSRPART